MAGHSPRRVFDRGSGIRCEGPVLRRTEREQQRRHEDDRRERQRRVARYEEQWLSHGQLFDGGLGYLFDPRPEPCAGSLREGSKG